MTDAPNAAIAVRIGTGKSTRKHVYHSIAAHQARNDWLTNQKWSGLRAGLPIIAAGCGDGQGLFIVGVLRSAERIERTAEDGGGSTLNWRYRHDVEWESDVFIGKIEGVLEQITSRRSLSWLSRQEFEQARRVLSVSTAAMSAVARERRLVDLRAR